MWADLGEPVGNAGKAVGEGARKGWLSVARSGRRGEREGRRWSTGWVEGVAVAGRERLVEGGGGGEGVAVGVVASTAKRGRSSAPSSEAGH